VDHSAADVWNSDRDRHLSSLLKAARKRLIRERPGSRVRLLAYAPAFQKRGVLHWHLVYGFKSPRESTDVVRFAEIVGELVEQYGFGKQFDAGQVFENARQAASYIARYMTADHQGLERVVTSSSCPARPVYVSRELMAESGVTMRFLRWRRWCWREIGVTAIDYCVRLHRLVLAMQAGIAAGHRKRLQDALRQLRPPPVVSTRSSVLGVQLALAV
jgi:hypothetical protein